MFHICSKFCKTIAPGHNGNLRDKMFHLDQIFFEEIWSSCNVFLQTSIRCLFVATFSLRQCTLKLRQKKPLLTVNLVNTKICLCFIQLTFEQLWRHFLSILGIFCERFSLTNFGNLATSSQFHQRTNVVFLSTCN